MNYIINPWVFYLLNLLGNIVVLCWSLMVIAAVAYLVYITVWWAADLCDSDKYPSPLAILKKWKIPVILCIVVLILIPSQETCYKMLIASQVTTEHIADAKETIKEVADYIVESAKEIKGDVE